MKNKTVPLRGWLACALGRHPWVGGSVEHNGMYRGQFWCMRCKIAYGEPPYDGVNRTKTYG